MTQARKPPLLVVKRLLVGQDGRKVYDQEFNLGVNIIRGANGTGKSSVMDLLYYGLGAEVTEWTDEQMACTHTNVEVLLNYRPFCLRREITETGKAPMYISEGLLKDALPESSTWYRYPNARSKDTHSYSQQLFELLGLPTHLTDDSQNLTMHQISRLLYVDQLTAASKLFKEDSRYDNATIRRAIGEYLLGIDDLDAHNLRQALIKANSNFDSIHSELKAIYRFLGSTDSVVSRDKLEGEIVELEERISELEANRQQVRNARIDSLSSDSRKRARAIQSKTREMSSEVAEYEENRSLLNSEIIDTSMFLESLNFRKSSLEQSQATSAAIGELVFKYCPACLSLLSDHSEGNACSLCKTEVDESNRHYAYIQMINEIDFQIRESKSLQEKYRSELEIIESALSRSREALARIKTEYSELIGNADVVDAALTEIGIEIGYCKSQIDHLKHKISTMERVDGLIERKSAAASEITKLEEMLAALEESTRNRVAEVYSSIESIASKLLSSDEGYESAFDNAEEVAFDFSRDRMSINGKSKFSASSMVIMKNSIRAAMFIHSVSDPLARFPRFIMIDNMEDKGMTPERSQNFQRVLVEQCDLLNDDHQMIFTTSMIDPALNESDYVVGPFYAKGMHSLAFA